MPRDLFIQIRGLGHTLPQVMTSLKSINTMWGGGSRRPPAWHIVMGLGVVDLLRIHLNLSFCTLD